MVFTQALNFEMWLKGRCSKYVNVTPECSYTLTIGVYIMLFVDALFMAMTAMSCYCITCMGITALKYIKKHIF